MIPELRKQYNDWMSDDKYQSFLNDLNSMLPYPVDFRISETPLFLTNELRDELVQASYDIVNQLTTDEFRTHSQTALPSGLATPHRTEHPLFLQVDFAIAEGVDGKLVPQLIELQGFPSLYGFQHFFAKKAQEFYSPLQSMTPYFGNITSDEYVRQLKNLILGTHDPVEVILMEIHPESQKTRIDFAATEALTGIETVCISKIEKQGNKLFYINRKGVRTQIKRIYNRVIIDELQRKSMPLNFSFSDELEVEWSGHPDWYFLISKHTLPFLQGKYVSDCHFISQLKEYPEDLENYVLKPLYSFAGLGVEVDVTKERLNAIIYKNDYILQKKISYAPLILTPDGYSKAEIRMMFLWDKEPILVNNLVRQSKGKMMGVDFNKNKTWVGSSCAFHS